MFQGGADLGSPTHSKMASFIELRRCADIAVAALTECLCSTRAGNGVSRPGSSRASRLGTLRDRATGHCRLEQLKCVPAAKFPVPNADRRRPSRSAQRRVAIPPPKGHRGYTELANNLRVGARAHHGRGRQQFVTSDLGSVRNNRNPSISYVAAKKIPPRFFLVRRLVRGIIKSWMGDRRGSIGPRFS